MSEPADQEAAVIGVDIGTTTVKVGLYTPDSIEHHVASRGYALSAPEPGWAEQDPTGIVDATFDALAEVARHARDHDVRVAGICISVPMHSLLGVDADGTALTPLITFADVRAAPQAQALRTDHLDVYRRTGTPLHPMSPLAKLCWLHEEQPELHARATRWVTLKEHLLRSLTGVSLLDHAGASATGLFSLETEDWDEEALRLARVDRERLAPLVRTDHLIDGLSDEAARRTGLAQDTPVVAGATDGVLANLGVGAMGAGIGAVTIGTSGAIRLTVDRPITDPHMRLFCYALTDTHWVIGGAISNGGLWLRWLREKVFDSGFDDEQLTALAAEVPPGADGVMVLPYLTGERAPQWSGTPSGVVFGLRFGHGREHLVRAGLEGVAHQLRWVRDALAEQDHTISVLRATGGFTASPLWLQLVADILDLPLEVPATQEAAAFGTAVLGMRALGMVSDFASVTDRVDVVRRIEPNSETHAVHEATHQRYRNLVAALQQSFEEAADR